MSQNSNWLEQIPQHLGWYFAGFVDGEGSFNVSVKKVPDRKIGWKLAASFNVSQRDKTVLILMEKYLGCGTLRQRMDGVTYYEVTSLGALKERILPFFHKYQLVSATKKKNFSIFESIIGIMVTGGGITSNGFNKIMYLRENLNKGKGRKRKYDITNVELKSINRLRETPQRLYAEALNSA